MIPEPEHPVAAPVPEDTPEHRLATSRERLRARLAPGSGGSRQQGGGAAASLLGEMVNPVVRDLARGHPYTLLAGSAAVGALVVWWKPWRVLGPLLLGSLARNAGAASVAMALRGVGRLWRDPAPPSRGAPAHRP